MRRRTDHPTLLIRPSLRRACVLGGLAVGALATTALAQTPAPELWRQVEIIRTTTGVPHIRAENFRAVGYALGWLMLEDYGPRTALGVLRSSGRMGMVFGRDSMESDFLERLTRERAVETYPRLQNETRDVYEGFAAGVNRYITLHRDEYPATMPTDFTGYDIFAGDIGGPAYGGVRRFLAKLDPKQFPPEPRRFGGPPSEGDEDELARDNVGSNAWAFAPSRTKSGKAILLRNPHLVWTSGYYEAHVTVPGQIDFYGDFRIGGPLTLIGGFNKDLGWSTTNNAQRLQEFYALEADPAQADHYLIDGTSVPLRRELVTVPYRNGAGVSSETREFWFTNAGPVIHRANGKIYILKSANDGEFHNGEQFLRMMRASSLAEWKAAMRLRARPTSNFTYADRAGNILMVWNASLPILPHPTGGDTLAIPVTRTSDMWTQYVPWDSLPQFLNPKGGYVHQENSSPHWTNLREPLDTNNRYPNFEKPSLSLRSQLALQLVSGTNKLSLEDVVKLKHSYRMLLADRVKPDLIAAVKATRPTGDVAAALAMMEQWDNTAGPDSKGANLFEVWWMRYGTGLADSLRYTRAWTSTDPTRTPYGLSQPAKAAEAFTWAVAETARRYGAYDTLWGAVHRVRRGPVDVPVGGCGGALGCFRVLNFGREADGKLAANGGDGWILAVEFGDTPRAYSALAYGSSSRPESPWYATQAELFAKGDLKPVAFTPADVEKAAVVRFRPGEPK
ncbi:MAG: penicillin acylase family protein [Gemmatimonadetes bacterium]|nr:penicillin acylase family protein [Gemmatimonadota bacterium]